MSQSPSQGALAGGTSLTITGSGFLPGVTLTLDGLACRSLVLDSPSQLSCLTPPHAAGAVDVRVANTDGRAFTSTAGYSYVFTPETAYGGPVLVQAFGDAPNAPTGTPSTKRVRVVWRRFSGAVAGDVYELLRVAQGGALDATATTSCTGTTTTTCLVCAVTEPAAPDCTDTQVGAVPAAYDYTVIRRGQDLPSPDPAYRIGVPVPPDNMVLVQRDAANYELCQLMGLASDPLNHQRCIYGGLGGAPYSIGPGKPALNLAAGFYDFGYNLFVDRWEAGCAWSGAPACGGADCFGAADPTITVADGSVFYNTTSGSCWVRQSSVWRQANDSALTAGSRALLYTNAPSKTARRPPIVNVNQAAAANVCSAVVDPNFGAKRLPRHREYVVAAAWPSLGEEPGALSDAQISAIEDGGAGHCNTDAGHNGTPVAFNTAAETAGSSTALLSFVTGSIATQSCVSRFGAQDIVGNVAEWFSDQLASCDTASPYKCHTVTSALDDGNRDMNSLTFDGVQGPGGQSGINSWAITARSFNANYFVAPLGLPFVGTDAGFALAIGTASLPNVKLHGDNFVLNNIGAVGTRGGYGGGTWFTGAGIPGRWYWGLNDTLTITYTRLGIRCVVAVP